MNTTDKRECPNGWSCPDCQHESFCAIGQYYIEPPIEITVIADKIDREVVKEAKKDARIITGTWFDNFNRMSSEQRWEEYGKWPTPHLHFKPALPLDGPTSPGGGSKSKCSKSKKGNKPTVYIWGSEV